MLKDPMTRTFQIAGELFTLTEYQTRGSEARIQVTFAQALNPAPVALDMYDGSNLWIEAVAKECLSDAPAWCWRQRQGSDAPSRFDAQRVITLEAFDRLTWPLFRKEVNAFLADLPQPLQPDEPPAAVRVPPDADSVATAETLPAVFRGRAE
jgi:hypothetical protein